MIFEQYLPLVTEIGPKLLSVTPLWDTSGSDRTSFVWVNGVRETPRCTHRSKDIVQERDVSVY